MSTVYDLTAEECAALAENAPGRWWVVIERSDYTNDYAPFPDQAFGPYPSEDAAVLALDSLLIEDACGDTKNPWNVDECTVEPEHAADAEVVLVDLTDWMHTGEEEPEDTDPAGGPLGIFRTGMEGTPPSLSEAQLERIADARHADLERIAEEARLKYTRL